MVRTSTYDPKEPVVEYEAPEEEPKFESVDVDYVLFALEDSKRDLYGTAENYDPDGPKENEAEPPAGPGLTEDDVINLSANVSNNTTSITDHEERISALESPE